jgi:hypothetical protein
MCGGERYVRRERALPGRFDRRSAATEIEQQITDGKLRDDLPKISRDKTSGWERNDDALIAGDSASGKGWKIRGSRNSNLDRGLPRLFLGDTRHRVAALGDIDQLNKGIGMVGVNVSGRWELDRRVRWHCETWGPDDG